MTVVSFGDACLGSVARQEWDRKFYRVVGKSLFA